MSADVLEQQYSKEEISLHNQDGDLWVIIDDVVFDLSKFQEDHPGGKKSSFYAALLPFSQSPIPSKCIILTYFF